MIYVKKKRGRESFSIVHDETAAEKTGQAP